MPISMLPTTEIEARCYYYGLPSRPRLIGRSSPHVWERPTGPEAYLIPKELMPLGRHYLQEVWEDIVGPSMDHYLQEKGVQCTSMTPLRIITEGQVSQAPAIIWIGVLPGSLELELGLEIALDCRSILVENGVEDIHVEIHESQSFRAAAVPMYKPEAYTLVCDHAAVLRDPLSTTLGIPICNVNTTNIEGTGAFFFTDKAKPGKLFMLTARHVLFDFEKEENKLYELTEGTDEHRRDVMLLGEAAFEARIKATKEAIDNKNFLLKSLDKRLVSANLKTNGENEAVAERESHALLAKTTRAREVVQAHEKLLDDLGRDWQDEGNRVIGHVVLSPPLSTHVGGYTDDWAVVEVHPTKISRMNFVGNVINLDYIKVGRRDEWLMPHTDTLGSFRKYTGESFHRFSGTISDQEMYKPHLSENDEPTHDPVTMVLKNGSTSNVTVGRLNTVRSFVRYHLEEKLGDMSREVAVLSRDYYTFGGAFAEPGDSGSVVVDAEGRVCGMITGGGGDTESFNCIFVTSIDFLVKRLKDFGIEANIFPLPTDL